MNVDGERVLARVPWLLAGGQEELVFALAEGREARARIFEMRASVYRHDGMEYHLRSGGPLHAAEDAFDEVSYHFYLRAADKLLTSGRYAPSRGGAWDVPELEPFMRAFPDEGRTGLVAGRGIVVPALRKFGLMTLLTHLGSAWMRDHTQYKYLAAICRLGLLELYRGVGYELLSNGEIEVVSRGGLRYVVVGGPLERVAAQAAHATQRVRLKQTKPEFRQ